MKLFREFIFCLLVSFLLVSCHDKDTYVIYGNLRCVNARTAYLMEMNSNGILETIDSAAIHAGEFKFRGSVDYPVMRFIQIESRRPFDVFVENRDIYISGTMLLPEEITISGSYSQEDFNYLQHEYKKILNKQNAVLVDISNAKKHFRRNEVKRLTRVYNSYPDSLLFMTKQFILQNPTSVGAAYFVCSLSETYGITRLEDIISLFDISIENSQYVQFLKQELILNQQLIVGSSAPEFELPTSTDGCVSLNDYSGKYLFIDFGASWCKGTELRNRRLAYFKNKYGDNNFDVLSISLDMDASQWKLSVSDSLLNWVQASDLLYWSSPVSKYYRVKQIPYGVLVDPEGKILQINPRLQAVEHLLEKIYGY